MKKEPLLRLWHIVERTEKHVSIGDNRRKVNYVLAAYLDDVNQEYRKSFESYNEPIVPNSGTHTQLNSLQYQWKSKGGN